MPKIIEYESKGTLQPNSEAYSAFEQAARRTGPLAQQSASDIEKLGRMASEAGSAASKFAYEYDSPFVSLLDKAAKAAAAPKERGGGGGLSTKGGVERTLLGDGSNRGATDNRDANLAGQAVKYSGQAVKHSGPDITRAAAALSRQANAQLNPKAAPGGGTIIGTDENGHPIIREKNGNIKTDESQNGQSINARGTDDITAGTVVLRGTGNTSGTPKSTEVIPWNGGGPEITNTRKGRSRMITINPGIDNAVDDQGHVVPNTPRSYPGNDAPDVGGMPSARSPDVSLDPQTAAGWPKKGKIAAGDAVDVEQGLGPEQGPLSQHAGGGIPLAPPDDSLGTRIVNAATSFDNAAAGVLNTATGGWFGSPFGGDTPADPVPTGNRAVIGGTVNDAGTWIPNQSVPMDPSVNAPQSQEGQTIPVDGSQ